MRAAARAFWAWYERHYTLNLAIATGLFLLQIVHLYWLTTDVVFARLFGQSFFDPQGAVEFVILLIDYTEIPALIGVSLIYVNELRQRFTWRSVAFLVLLNSQWLHILWITDEFVVASLTGEAAVALPAWLAWIAIGIDYLELPVMVDTLAKLTRRIVARSRGDLVEVDDAADP